MLWAISGWYAARVLLYLGFPGVHCAQFHSKFAETQVLGILGIVPILIVGWEDRWRRVDRDRPNWWYPKLKLGHFRRTQQLDQFRRLC